MDGLDTPAAEIDLNHRMWLMIFGRRDGRVSFYALCALLVVCAVLAFAFLVSVPFHTRISPGLHHEIYLTSGRLNYEWHQTPVTDAWYVAINNSGGVDWMFDHHRYPTSWFVRIPLWFPFTIFGAAALWLIYCRWWGLSAPGCCVRCGYTLRGLQRTAPETGEITCPECGTRQPARRDPQKAAEVTANAGKSVAS